MTDTEISAFLSGPRNPEHEVLLRLIGASILDPRNQGFLRGLHGRMCKTGFACRALAGKRHAMCPTRQRPICTNDGESRRVGWEPREAVSCCASLL